MKQQILNWPGAGLERQAGEAQRSLRPGKGSDGDDLGLGPEGMEGTAAQAPGRAPEGGYVAQAKWVQTARSPGWAQDPWRGPGFGLVPADQS